MKITSRLIRKSLYGLCVEAAAAQGIEFKTEVINGSLEYILNGKQMTPGETADALGVVWGSQ